MYVQTKIKKIKLNAQKAKNKKRPKILTAAENDYLENARSPDFCCFPIGPNDFGLVKLAGFRERVLTTGRHHFQVFPFGRRKQKKLFFGLRRRSKKFRIRFHFCHLMRRN
jgi:hypothetical protein